MSKTESIYFASIRLALMAAMGALLMTATMWADPPPPNQQSTCGGHCQAVCINGCDGRVQYLDGYNWSSIYSWLQARCVVVKEDSSGGYTNVARDSKGPYCMDGFNCDYGPCGREGERGCDFLGGGCTACQTGLRLSGTKCVRY